MKIPLSISLQEEIRQTKPFRSKQHEGVIALFRTADLLRRENSNLIEPFGLTAQQYNVLRILRGAGEQGLPTLEIADRMVEQTPGITRLLDKLETKKLVRRERQELDRRQVFCWITVAGTKLLAKLDPLVDENVNRSLSALKEKDLDQFVEMLARVRESLR